MRPYNGLERRTKGLVGTRKSIASSHRKRCLRVDKRAARQYGRKFGIENYQPDDWKDW